MFNNDATISGHPGIITMCLFDKDNRFSKDTQRISLKPGESLGSRRLASNKLGNRTRGSQDGSVSVQLRSLSRT